MLPTSLEDINKSLIAQAHGLEFEDLTQFMRQLAHVIQTASCQGATRKELEFSQALDVAEEAGEFAGAYRRYLGFARRAGTRQEMLDELSDVLIASLIMFVTLKEDPQAAVRKKLSTILTRGYVNKEAV